MFPPLHMTHIFNSYSYDMPLLLPSNTITLATVTETKSCAFLPCIHPMNPTNSDGQIIRIFHGCKGRIEKSIPRITVWRHEACRVMTNGDPEGRIFLS